MNKVFYDPFLKLSCFFSLCLSLHTAIEMPSQGPIHQQKLMGVIHDV